MEGNKIRFLVYGIAMLIAVLSVASVATFSDIAGEPTKQTAPTETVQEAETTEVQPAEAVLSPNPAPENIAPENLVTETTTPETKEEPKEEAKTEPAQENNIKDK